MSPGPPDALAARFRAHLGKAGVVEDGDGVLVGLSGGADSVVLLHLLRFTQGLPALRVVAVHVDHGMRPDSGADARWVEGLCRAWDVPLRTVRLDPPPGTRRRRAAAATRRWRRRAGRWTPAACSRPTTPTIRRRRSSSGP